MKSTGPCPKNCARHESGVRHPTTSLHARIRHRRSGGDDPCCEDLSRDKTERRARGRGGILNFCFCTKAIAGGRATVRSEGLTIMKSVYEKAVRNFTETARKLARRDQHFRQASFAEFKMLMAFEAFDDED